MADLLNVSILGITRTEFAPPLIEDLCARLAAATINMTGPLGDVPRLLQALRVALKDADPPIPDILPGVVGHLMSAFQMALTARRSTRRLPGRRQRPRPVRSLRT